MKSALFCCLIFMSAIALNAQEVVRPFANDSRTSKTFALQKNIHSILQNSPGEILMELPGLDGKQVTARIKRNQELAPNYAIKSNHGSRIAFEQPTCYIGKLDGIKYSTVMILSK